jgi:phosphate transport system substrate-binding protein
MKNAWLAALACGLLAIGAAGCGGDDDDSATAGGGGDLSGPVTIDGSSTVFPFAQAAAEGFQGENSGVKVTVGESGTGGGFEKFCAGETDIADASRPIDEEEEVPLCEKNGIEYSAVQIANDGIAVVSNPDLKIACLTTDQLKALWKKGSSITNYDQLGDGIPSGKVSLYGPGTDSGTFDFFTEEINGEKGDTRTDYQPSEDDNVLVQGVAGDKAAIGYFGFSYYEDNKDKLNLIAVDSGDGCIKPSTQTIQDGTYKPLSRPLFMYPNTKSFDSKPQVKGFMDYTVDNAVEIAGVANIVPMTDEQLTKAKAAVPGT